jgi:hypothetical protein
MMTDGFEPRAQFTAMDNGTQEDWAIISGHIWALQAKLPTACSII